MMNTEDDDNLKALALFLDAEVRDDSGPSSTSVQDVNDEKGKIIIIIGI